MPVAALLRRSDFGMVRADLGAAADAFQGIAFAFVPPFPAGARRDTS
jgi:hypothetical protein